MRILALLATLFTSPAYADGEIYADVGLGHMWGSTLAGARTKSLPDEPGGGSGQQIVPVEADGPHVVIEAGYKFGQTSVFALHASSITSGRDAGMNFVGVKHRFSVRLP